MSPNNCDKCGHDRSMCECITKHVPQVGGQHYAGEYQHWDWADDVRLLPLLYAATKYIVRLGSKQGESRETAIRKALSYIEKDMKIGQFLRRKEVHPSKITVSTLKLIDAAELRAEQYAVLQAAASIQNMNDMRRLYTMVESLLDSETAIMRSRVDHPSPFGYEEDLHS